MRTDFLIGHSTSRGFVSYRGPEGSWYLQELGKALLAHHRTLHVTDILTEVNRTVVEYETRPTIDPETSQFKQAPFFYSSLRGKVFLNSHF